LPATGERIRDKIAASKAKGMWMGGPLPLGYDVRDRLLVINEAEAALVRRIFDDFVTMRSATLIVKVYGAEGLVTKGGRPFTKQTIYKRVLEVLTWRYRTCNESMAQPVVCPCAPAHQNK